MNETSGKPIRRVLMTADTLGGVWTYALELTRTLGTFGIEVSLATMGRALDARQRSEVARIGNLTVHESEYRLEWMHTPWEDVESAGKWLLNLEEGICPDIVHLNGFAHGALPWRTPVLMAGHSCVYSWYESVRGRSPSPDWDRYREEVTRGLRAAGFVTAPSGTMLRALRRFYGEFRAVAPVYNGRSAAMFTPGTKEPVIMAAGRIWDEAKNIRLLEKMSGEIPWPIYAAGEQRHPDGGETGLTGIGYLGNLGPEDLAGWLGRASIFVLPARYEPFGLCALEAALAGCTLVLGDIPSLREIWGSTALYVPPDSPDILESTLRRLIEHDGLRNLLRNRSRARALEFTPERMGREYLNLYERLVCLKGEIPV